MNNPNFPNRKIRHAELLKEAGFEINMRWYQNKDKPQILCNVTKLIYWERGDIHLTIFDYETISLVNLIDRIEAQVKYNCRKNARVIID